LLLLLLATVPGCREEKVTYPVLPENTAAEGFVIETKPFEIGDETYMADFGTIAVPENRSAPASRLIHIPYLRIRSNAKDPAEPVFGLSGGPGSSNMSWNWEFARMFLPERDFVLVGYRGVDGSVRLDCPEVAEAMKAKGDLLGEASMKTLGGSWTTCAERLKASGVDLDGYTMLDVIEDNESVRRALGYDRINLESESYGTRVAYLYGLKHPGSVFRSAMIGVNPPGHFVWEPRMIDDQLKYYAALWAKDPEMSKKSPDLYRTMAKVLGDMPDKWLCFRINPGKVKLVTFALLYHRKTSAQVFDAFLAAERGDPSGLAILSLSSDYILPSLSVWGESASKAVSADYDPGRNYLEEMDSRVFPMGAPMSKIMWAPLSFGEWPIRPIPEEFRKPQPSEVETLLLSGNIDFSTPAEFATNELLPYLKNGQQVIFSECGHVGDVVYSNWENTRRILTSYYKTGTPDTSLNAYIPMDFHVKWGFPAIAKIAVGAVIFVGIILLSILFWLIRRRVRRVTG